MGLVRYFVVERLRQGGDVTGAMFFWCCGLQTIHLVRLMSMPPSRERNPTGRIFCRSVFTSLSLSMSMCAYTAPQLGMRGF